MSPLLFFNPAGFYTAGTDPDPLGLAVLHGPDPLKSFLVLLWAWLTLYPTMGFLPHISHTLDIAHLLILNTRINENSTFILKKQYFFTLFQK